MAAYWIIFALYCAAHLVACFFEKEPIRKATKIVIIPLLSVSLFLTQTHNPLLFLGLALGWIGDIFMIFDRTKKYFITGTAFFVLGHFFYIAATLQQFFETNRISDIPACLWIIWVLAAIALFLASKLKISKHIGPIAYLGSSYFTVLVAALLLNLAAGRYLTAIAFSVFMLSDAILSVCRFAKEVQREHFYVMSSYIAAQTLICISFICG